MKTREILTSIDNCLPVSYEDLAGKFNTIKVYIRENYFCDAVFMVTFLTNNICGGYIVPVDNYQEELDRLAEDEEDKELINFSSFIIQ